MTTPTTSAQYSSGPQAPNPAEVGWLPCAPCDGTGVVYAAGPDYFGNYDSDDCPACRGHGAVPSVTSHDTTVVEGTALWWAQCTCGWIAAARPSEAAADRDLAIHRSWVENDPGTLDRFGRP